MARCNACAYRRAVALLPGPVFSVTYATPYKILVPTVASILFSSRHSFAGGQSNLWRFFGPSTTLHPLSRCCPCAPRCIHHRPRVSTPHKPTHVCARAHTRSRPPPDSESTRNKSHGHHEADQQTVNRPHTHTHTHAHTHTHTVTLSPPDRPPHSQSPSRGAPVLKNKTRRHHKCLN